MLFKVDCLPHRNRPVFIRCKCCGRYRHAKYTVKKIKWGFRWVSMKVGGKKMMGTKKVPITAKFNFACSKRCADALTLQMM